MVLRERNERDDTAAIQAAKTILNPTINNISTSDVKNSIGKTIGTKYHHRTNFKILKKKKD